MTNLSLRVRVFLFFCLIGLGGVVVVLGALFLGYRQLGSPAALSAFTTVAVTAGFGILGLAMFVWRLFDEHLSKPIEAIAAQFRVRANAGVEMVIDAETAKYLGDLAPAASAIAAKLEKASQDTAETVAQKTARLERQRAQLLRILSDIPVAVIVATSDDQIVLYDGQAADLMEREASARLHGSVCDYLVEADLRSALDTLRRQRLDRCPITIQGKSGDLYSGHIRAFEHDQGYMLMLEPLTPDAARPLVYDFDLLEKDASRNLSVQLNDTALRDLCVVVFDSETTGLNPSKDDVVQLGAVRIVNGKIIAAETFDTLVNPGRPIPAQSSKVHGITDTMVEGAPDFDLAVAGFKTFVADAVLVAHNAPFDMAFLNRKTPHDDRLFPNAVIDTVHLSAIVFGGSAVHTLDALCGRLGINIPDTARHTALGDALVTAEVFVALLPILEARGLSTFGRIKEEAQKHSRLLKLHE